MFFMAGITQGTKEIPCGQSVFICSRCGRYGRYQVYMTYLCLSLFFIPVLKWKKEYYVKTSCCGAVYSLDPEVGKRLSRGEELEIQEGDLTLISGHEGQSLPNAGSKRCAGCGYETDEDFDFCPKCGRRFDETRR